MQNKKNTAKEEKQVKDEDKGREKEPTAVPSPPTKRTPLPYRNMRHMRGNNKRNGNGKETGMENRKGYRMPSNPPLSPTKRSHPSLPRERLIPKQLERRRSKPSPSCQKKPPFPTAEKNVSLSLLLKKANCRSLKRLPSLLPKAMLHFPYCQKNSLPYRRKNNVSLPTAENKITPR